MFGETNLSGHNNSNSQDAEMSMLLPHRLWNQLSGENKVLATNVPTGPLWLADFIDRVSSLALVDTQISTFDLSVLSQLALLQSL